MVKLPADFAQQSVNYAEYSGIDLTEDPYRGALFCGRQRTACLRSLAQL